MSSAALLHLPQELLLLILVNAGRHDLKSLASLAATCRQLRNMVYGEDLTIWMLLHAQLYDKPRRASAFLEPQEPYDWRTSVVERDWFHVNSRPPSRSDHHPLVVDTQRACAIMLDLYDDLSITTMADRAAPCLNLGLLNQLRSPEFAWACQERMSDGGDALARLHLLRLALDEDRRARRERLRARVPKVWECVKERRLQAPLRTDGTVAWIYIDAVASEMFLCKDSSVLDLGDDPDGRSVAGSDMSERVELDDIRGRGLLGVVPDGDWLGVSGRWKCEAYRFNATLVGPWEVGEYDIAPIELRVLRRAYLRASPRAEPHLKLLQSKFPTTTALPTIYFMGEGPGLPRDPGGERLVGRHFVCGAARLTADHPPQIVWTWVVENLGDNDGYEDFAMLIEAVQIGGRESKAGMYGKYCDLYMYDGRGVGGVRMWKDDSDQSEASRLSPPEADLGPA